MPHLIASSAKLPTFPFEEGGFIFLCEARSLRNPHLSMLRVNYPSDHGLYDFCILKIEQERGFLFKGEKSTRPIPVNILKQALRVLARYCQNTEGNLGLDLVKPCACLIDWSVFKIPSSFHLEIGFGSGRHLLNKAMSNPEEFYIGVEVHTPSIEQVLRQIKILGLQNLYITYADARTLLEVLPKRCVGLDVHFPVPWPKNPQRRIWTAKTLAHMLAILRPKSLLWLRTDNLDYFKESLHLALDLPHCTMQVFKNSAQEMVVSKYEARWKRQHKDIYDLHLQIEDMPDKSQQPLLLKCSTKISINPSLKACTLWHNQVVQQDYFLRVVDVLEYKNLWLLVVSLGDLQAPLNKVLVLDKNKGSLEYIGGLPFNTKAHRYAHQKLEEILG
ncbi:tRNA (guanosine(46)-N7)-methyltransferase TrmB [Helicobacter suis]|uniref:tRNA (guanosine(46)-N7)-methyltransferase TrmB n=1 Tax=Helicobacter suis TaxID=104628 RepID=UPI002491D11F|nr:tRNA (guanosine(46)-N7)-methyltransferase TrmB [Helicobacter suis]